MCQSATPWSASGAKLGPTVSACERCVADVDGANGGSVEETEGEEDELEFDYHRDDYDDGGDEGHASDYDEKEDGSNQVVPWSSSAPLAPSARSSSSTSEESSIRICNRDSDSSPTPFSLKRNRQDSQGDLGHRIYRQNNIMTVGLSNGEYETPADYLRPLTDRGIEPASTLSVEDISGKFPPMRTRRRR